MGDSGEALKPWRRSLACGGTLGAASFWVDSAGGQAGRLRVSPEAGSSPAD